MSLLRLWLGSLALEHTVQVRRRGRQLRRHYHFGCRRLRNLGRARLRPEAHLALRQLLHSLLRVTNLSLAGPRR